MIVRLLEYKLWRWSVLLLIVLILQVAGLLGFFISVLIFLLIRHENVWSDSRGPPFWRPLEYIGLDEVFIGMLKFAWAHFREEDPHIAVIPILSRLLVVEAFVLVIGEGVGYVF